MARILPFQAPRKASRPHREATAATPPKQPQFSDSDLWTRDYRQLGNIVHAVIKMKEILDYHLYYDDVWPYLLLAFMESVHNAKQDEPQTIIGTGASLKDYVVSAITPDNKRDLTMVLLLTDLIEKSPGYRARPSRRESTLSHPVGVSPS